MGYYITYYAKKYWYVMSLILLLGFLYMILYINDITLVTYFEKFENKVSFEPEHFKEEKVDKEYLNTLNVGAPYIGTQSRPYIPPSVLGSEAERAFLRDLEKDPTIMYKKNIDWSSGEITSDQIKELIELVGYHLNKNNNNVTTLVELPTLEELEEYDQEVIYYTESEGTLNLNISVEEVNVKSITKRTYCYTYKLKYGMDGKITIR